MSGDLDRETCDSKICATKIKIGAKLNIAGLVKCAIDFTMARINRQVQMRGMERVLPQGIMERVPLVILLV